MPDIFAPEKRHEIMQNVKTNNTAPEIKLRSLLHKNGFRFRVNRKDLPGKPDIVLPKYRAVIFVHGCFWHGHDCPRGQRPQTNADFWKQKIDRNVIRDKSDVSLLESLGWRVLIVWECEIKKKNEAVLLSQVKEFLLHSANTIKNP